jgi:hypothetical protein
MRQFILLSLICLLASCANNGGKPLSAEHKAALRGGTVAPVQGATSGFLVMTPAKVMGAAVVGIAAGVAAGGGYAGNMLANQSMQSALRPQIKLGDGISVTDPAGEIAANLARSLSQKTGARVIPAARSQVDSQRYKDVVAAAPGATYILRVTTLGMGCSYHPLKWLTYHFNGVIQMELIQASTRKVVSSSTYQRIYKKSRGVKHDDILANNAAYVKQEMEMAKREAEAQFAAVLLK